MYSNKLYGSMQDALESYLRPPDPFFTDDTERRGNDTGASNHNPYASKNVIKKKLLA